VEEILFWSAVDKRRGYCCTAARVEAYGVVVILLARRPAMGLAVGGMAAGRTERLPVESIDAEREAP